MLNADLADQFVELHSMPSPLWQKVIVNWQSVTLAVARWRYLVKVTEGPFLRRRQYLTWQ
ncbi:hypothetical protein OKT24_16440 [Aeromonas veronii]|nr:hypothetical protein [Aeromonas veronii]